LIVVPRPSLPTLSQEKKERGMERGREGERRRRREGGAAEKNTRQMCTASV
jgi:hypothetical protein